MAEPTVRDAPAGVAGDARRRAGIFRRRRLTEAEQREAYFTATQWRLIWLKFRSHRWATWGMGVVVVFYFVAVFNGFFAINDPVERNTDIQLQPWLFSGDDVSFSLFDEQRNFRPVVYQVTSRLDFELFKRVYERVEGSERPLRLFARGYRYKLLFFIDADLHLLGTGDPEVRWFPLGTDQSGRCLFSRMVHGSILSLSIGILAIVITWVLGILIGSIAGYFGGVVDNIINRFIETLMSVPSLPLWIALAGALPLDWGIVEIYFSITIVLSILGWTGLARTVRSKFLALREEEYLLAAKLDGAPVSRQLFRHMLPGFASHLVVDASNRIPQMILGETALSFLGVGLRPPAVSWGVLLQGAQNVESVALHPWLLLPALLVIATVVAFQFLGDGLRDAVDPYR